MRLLSKSAPKPPNVLEAKVIPSNEPVEEVPQTFKFLTVLFCAPLDPEAK
jgi:hypothetical protein